MSELSGGRKRIVVAEIGGCYQCPDGAVRKDEFNVPRDRACWNGGKPVTEPITENDRPFMSHCELEEVPE